MALYTARRLVVLLVVKKLTWRIKIIEIDEIDYLVQFLDYGNVEHVAFDAVFEYHS